MSTDDDEALEARRARLAEALKAAKPRPATTSKSDSSTGDSTAAAMSMGLRAGSEFVAAIVIGGAIGWGLDWLLHTRPAFTIAFFLFGVVAGVWNVIRATSPKGGK